MLAQFASSASQSTTTEAGTFAGSTALTWSVPIVALTQRLEGQDPAGSISEPVQGALSARATAFSSSSLVGMPSSAGPDEPLTTMATDLSEICAPDQSAPALIVTAETPLSSSGGFTFRIAAGPFVSRNAGPLGPILASVGRDPTPEVDRNERAHYQDIERRDSNDGDDHDATMGLTGTETGEDEPDGAAGAVYSVTGPGGFPLKVTKLAGQRRTNLSELVSAIPTPVERPGTDSHDSTEQAAIAEASSQANPPAIANYIKAACVLAFGLGMSSRALFPNLLTSVRRRIPRSFVHRKSDPRKS